MKVVSSSPQDTMWSERGSSTSWYVFVKKGAGTAFCDSTENTISSHLSTVNAINYQLEALDQENQMIYNSSTTKIYYQQSLQVQSV